MGSTPSWKVYSEGGEYIAAFKDIVDAAQFISLEEGRSIRYGHKSADTIWTQHSPYEPNFPEAYYGVTGDAGESFDAVVEAADMWDRGPREEWRAYCEEHSSIF